MWVMFVHGVGHPLRGADSYETIEAYLADADFEANDGRGLFQFTDDPQKAHHFERPVDVYNFWNTQSQTHPIRRIEEGGDGKPNKPLTQFTIEARKV